MFPALDEICAAYIDDGGEAFGGVDDEVVVFEHLELTKFLSLGGLVENTFIDCLMSTERLEVQTSGTESLISFESTKPSEINAEPSTDIPLHSSNICIVSRGKGRRFPMSGSPANTLFICLVNSVRSSSLIVCETFELDP